MLNTYIILLILIAFYQTQSTLKSTSFLDSKLPSLLLVLCWYAFQPNTLAIK